MDKIRLGWVWLALLLPAQGAIAQHRAFTSIQCGSSGTADTSDGQDELVDGVLDPFSSRHTPCAVVF